MGLDYGVRLWSVDCVLAMLDESSSRVDVFFMNWINDESVTDVWRPRLRYQSFKELGFAYFGRKFLVCIEFYI